MVKEAVCCSENKTDLLSVFVQTFGVACEGSLYVKLTGLYG